MLLLNAVLTVRVDEANSHKNKGWEQFTDAIIEKVNAKPEPVVFVLWGGYAKKKERLIDASRHVIIKSAHPSPLSCGTMVFWEAGRFPGSMSALQGSGVERSIGNCNPWDRQSPDWLFLIEEGKCKSQSQSGDWRSQRATRPGDPWWGRPAMSDSVAKSFCYSRN